jgi:SAM-dependent methyltransferase
MPTQEAAIEFWNKLFAEGQNLKYRLVGFPDLDNPVLNAALKHFGNVEGKRVLDLGCGNGAASLFFAQHGAKVVSVDYSDVAIRNLAEFCQSQNIDTITPVQLAAQDIPSLGSVDFVYGSMILHHIEPFHEFATILRSTIRPGGKAFFHENNATSRLLIWFRQNVVGKLWVPKYGDPDEFPLMPSEVDELRKHFDVQVFVPELCFFQLISAYLLRGHLKRPFKLLDTFFYRFRPLRKWSYYQYLFLS